MSSYPIKLRVRNQNEITISRKTAGYKRKKASKNPKFQACSGVRPGGKVRQITGCDVCNQQIQAVFAREVWQQYDAARAIGAEEQFRLAEIR